MFDIRLTEGTEHPLYIQLYQYIRQLIESGALQNGSKLPSIRALREQSGLSRTTIETAYHMLLEEGTIYSKPRSGIYVSSGSGTESAYQIPSLTVNGSAIASPAHAYTERPHTALDDAVIDFNMLTVDRGTFPAAAWRSAASDALTLYSENLQQYGDPQGEYGLRASIAQYLNRSRRVLCTPEQIVVGSGISSNLQLLARLLPDVSVIAVEREGIAQVRKKLQQHGFRLTAIPMVREVPWAAELTSQDIRAVYVTPSHRPAGQPLTYPLRCQLLDWAKQNNGYVIEDDYDGEFHYSGRTVPSLQSMDDAGTVIYLGTFSKSFTPALRMGYVVLPAPLLSKLKELEQVLSPPSRIDQWAMELFMKRGHWYRHIRRMRTVYKRKHSKLSELIHTYWPGRVHINGDCAGLHLEITVQTSYSARQLVDLAARAGILIYHQQDVEERTAAANSKDHQGEPRLYLGFGGLSAAEMTQGIQRLARAWSHIWQP
ncbi:MocR-like pyridoxine biosynthesis transcription factor PdxR [Paenibacillus xylaniclasticus]|uniref:MocR-like pyridoxine biosynthesis transcription factor PdxR n=1 Tax=Paenibacillus xylaniclasticus TaxID=588083 RepID=UPI000FD6DBB3|nr:MULTISPECIES: PLP-dependent aminotransferase family protein [Paenibacillus]GFN34051.1 putative HTH-type transcriptional regulator YdeL [Paenibacillus curdlanolyticus]